MAKISTLEKFKGEIDGEFTSLWVATDVNKNRFLAFDLVLKQEGEKIMNDVKNTKWLKLPEERYKEISIQLHAVHHENYLESKHKPLHETPSSAEEYKGRSR